MDKGEAGRVNRVVRVVVVDDEALVRSGFGLILGAALGKDARDGSGDGLLFAPALLSGPGKLSLGLPIPTPALMWNATRSERVRGWKINLLDLQF